MIRRAGMRSSRMLADDAPVASAEAVETAEAKMAEDKVNLDDDHDVAAPKAPEAEKTDDLRETTDVNEQKIVETKKEEINKINVQHVIMLAVFGAGALGSILAFTCLKRVRPSSQ